MPPTKYHNYDELTKALQSLHERWPNLTRLYKLSEKTVGNRELWVLQISTDVGKERTVLKPMVKYVANMHGNEAVGREMMISLSEYLLEAYSSGSDEELKALIDTTDMHILPSMNPEI